MVGFKPIDVPPTAAVKFIGAGTAACIADLVTFPLDTAKVRLQVRSIANQDEAPALYEYPCAEKVAFKLVLLQQFLNCTAISG